MLQGFARPSAHLGPEQGDRFGRITNVGVAVVEQPLRQGGFLQADLAQTAAGDQALALLAQQHVQGPGAIGGINTTEVGDEGIHPGLGAAAGIEGAVEIGEATHAGLSPPAVRR